MSTETPSAIIISDGGLPALVAAAIEAERAISGGRPDGSGAAPASILLWPSGPVLASAQFTAVTSQARFYRHHLADTPQLCAHGATPSTTLVDTLGLLAAVEVARAAGCGRVVWPVQYHSDHDSLPGELDRIAGAVDRALLVTRLGMLDGVCARVEVTIETPLVDLTDSQIADLVVDLDAPAYLCWWWRRLGDPEAESLAAPERKAWLTALRDAGWVQTAPGVTVSTSAAPGIEVARPATDP